MKVGVHRSSKINVFVSIPSSRIATSYGSFFFFFFHLYNSLEMTDYGAGKQMKGYQELRRERGGSGCGH